MMEYKAGDLIAHPHHGIGRVLKIVKKWINLREEQEYYEIELANGKIWVPVQDPPTDLRMAIGEDEIDRCREVLMEASIPLATDYRERKSELEERKQDTTFEGRCELLRDLSAFRSSRPLSEQGSSLLRATRDLVAEEWAAAQGVPIGEAANEIVRLLAKGRRAHQSQE